MAAAPGYSGTPLPQKLGLKDGQRALFLGLPEELAELKSSRNFTEVRDAGWDDWRDTSGWDFVHGFTTVRGVLEDNARPLMDSIDRNGVIWISWPKRTSRIATDLTEDAIREVVLPLGLVDIKVAAVSDVWSGLKLMIRRELR